MTLKVEVSKMYSLSQKLFRNNCSPPQSGRNRFPLTGSLISQFAYVTVRLIVGQESHLWILSPTQMILVQKTQSHSLKPLAKGTRYIHHVTEKPAPICSDPSRATLSRRDSSSNQTVEGKQSASRKNLIEQRAKARPNLVKVQPNQGSQLNLPQSQVTAQPNPELWLQLPPNKINNRPLIDFFSETFCL